jgi:predicted choloylglycine hydrolase
VLRYILEFCHQLEEAVAVLRRVPLHMPYNVTLLDRQGEACTVAICPGEEARVYPHPFATNHQPGERMDDQDSTADSYMRESFLAARLGDPAQSEEALLQMFMSTPLLRKASDWNGWGTLYTARYLPQEGAMELHWPAGQVMRQSFTEFTEAHVDISSPGFQ